MDHRKIDVLVEILEIGVFRARIQSSNPLMWKVELKL